MVDDGRLRQRRLDENATRWIEVQFYGTKSRGFMRELLSRANAYSQLSVTGRDNDMEYFGVSLVETMASSVAVVLNYHNGFPQTVAGGNTELLFLEFEVDAMTDTITKFTRDREL